MNPSKSVEKRLAVQRTIRDYAPNESEETDYNRGFRHGLANSRENLHANIALIEKLRGENARLRGRLQDLELFIDKLYKFNHNEGISF